MKSFRHCVVLLLCLLLLVGGTGVGRAAELAAGRSDTPGLAAAQAISTITGVAISPLLGVSGVGAYKWFKAPPEKRAGLAWYAQPWFWVPALTLVLLALIKDTFGTALPTAVKKPFDMAELIENKISGLVAAGAFVPLIALIFKSAGDDGTWLESTGLTMAAVGDLTAWLNILTIPFAIAVFLVVFLVSHVINVLILISPFTTVDTALKGIRAAVLSTVVLTSFADPYVGAVWSLCIVLVCWFLAGWALRFFVFGTVFTWDLGTVRKSRFKVDPVNNWVFTSRKIGKTPIRTYGKLSRGPQGELSLSYRPWLVLPKRVLTLPSGQYAVGRGLLYSELVLLDDEEGTDQVTLPPRYRTHEEEMNAAYGLAGVRDTGVVKGMKTVWKGVRELFGFRPAGIAA
ncbi:MAG TPA: hypothetical protein VNU68_34250 [Verrucomicrobiae bacterium]|nr:hypothetical protein [Verrucomicrobiae bacterium]